MKEAPSDGGFFCFRDTPNGKSSGVGYLEGRVRVQTVMSIIDTNTYRILEVRRCRRKKWLVGDMNDFYRYFRPIIRTL